MRHIWDWYQHAPRCTPGCFIVIIQYDEHNSPTLGYSSGMHSAVSLKGLFSGSLSGTLEDVLMFTSGTCPAALEIPGMTVEKDAGLISQCINTGNSIEWQLLKDGANRNANPLKFTGAECRLPVPNQNHYTMTPAGPWDCARMEERVVNYLQAFGPVQTDSRRYSVDGQVGEIKLTLDGQLLNSVVRTGVSDRMKSPDMGEGHLGAGSPTERSRVLGANSSDQRLYARGIAIPSSAPLQTLNRSPIQGIQNLTREQSSKFLSHDGMVNKVNERLHVPKKARISDYTGASLAQAEDKADHLDHGSQYGKALPHDQLVSLLAPPSYKTVSSSFISSLPDRSSNIPSLQNTSLSDFSNSGPASSVNNLNESASLKSFPLDYRFSNDTSSVQGGFTSWAAQGGLLVSGRNSFVALNLMEPPGLQGKQVSLSRNFMQPGSPGSLGQVCSGRHTAVDTGAAWPAGLINSPSLGFESASGVSKSIISQRSFFDAKQPDGLRGDKEAGRGRPNLESRIRLLIQKQLTTTDVGSLGRVILPKKEAETHLPHLPDKEGIEMCLYDYDVERSWVMKYRFWPNNKSRMYLLENTGEFLKYHDLQQGDLLLIYWEPPVRYVLRGKKMMRPLIPVTPSHGIIESGGSAAEDVGPAGSVPWRPMSTPSASQEVSGTSASDYQLSRNILSSSSRSAFSPTGRPRSLSSQDILDAEPPRQLRISSKHRHQVANVTENDDQQPCLNSSFSQEQHKISADLDGQGDYNLEEFPSLIEAIIDNICPSHTSNNGPTSEILGRNRDVNREAEVINVSI